MKSLERLGEWMEKGNFGTVSSAQRVLFSVGSACGAADPDKKPSACGAADPDKKPSACGAADPDKKPSACGAADPDKK